MITFINSIKYDQHIKLGILVPNFKLNKLRHNLNLYLKIVLLYLSNNNTLMQLIKLSIITKILN